MQMPKLYILITLIFERFFATNEDYQDALMTYHYSPDSKLDPYHLTAKKFLEKVNKNSLKADLVIMTSEEFKEELESYHNSMEGYE